MLDLLNANVVPKELNRRQPGSASARENDDRFALITNLGAASGGYDFLLQVSNSVSAQTAFDSLKLYFLVGRIDAEAVRALRASGQTPTSPALQALIAPDAPDAPAFGVDADVLILFSRKDVLFESQASCRVRANVRVAIGKYSRVPPTPPVVKDPLPGETVQNFATEIVRLGEGVLREFVQTSIAAELQQSVANQSVTGRSMPVRTMPVASGTFSGQNAHDTVTEFIDERSYLQKHVELGYRQGFDVTAWLGGGVLEVLAPFAAKGEQSSATIRVSADASASNALYNNLTLDASLLLSSADPTGLVALTTHRVRERGQVELVKQISLVGASATSRVNNLSQLSPQAFPCGHGACPLSVGATIVAWHVGSPNAVRLVGSTGYAVLWSAEAVSLLVHYCWENRYFPRSALQSSLVKLTIDGNDQDAVAESSVMLQTLVRVGLNYDANNRTDVLQIGGNASVVPQRIRLADGRVLTPANPSDPIFAPGPVRPWNATGTLTEDHVTGASPEIVNFERQVTNSTTSRLGRPFVEGDGTVLYSRISAFSQCIMLLAE